jgi:hypothetical protein
MGKSPAFQFYPSDWSRDMEEHPLEIEGAWIRICCKLWWSETPGSMTKTIEQWSRILKNSRVKSLKILKYLEENRVCDLLNQNGDITIISRRMVRDEYIRKIRKEAGEKGGNPALKKNVDLLNQSSNQNSSKSQPLHLQSSSSSSLTTKKEKIYKDIYGEFGNVLLTPEEKKKLDEKFGTSGSMALIENLSAYIASKGKKYSSHYATILNWERKNNGENRPRTIENNPALPGIKPSKYGHLVTTIRTED